MPVQTPLAVAIFFTMWWVVLLTVLPFGVHTHEEEGEDLPKGCDPGAPTRPRLALKALITTGVTSVLFTVFMIVLKIMG